MKAIINGLRYDTTKAELIGEAWHGYAGDFTHWEAGLYRTPRAKRFFLAGAGGPMTRWGKRGCQQNETVGSIGIIPLDAEDALAWAEQFLAAAEIEAAFGQTLQDA